ncbi:putative immune-type receptor 7 precursor, partial [Clarias magur]
TMITRFVALYSLLCLCTTGNTSDIKEPRVKTVKLGETVTMECNISGDKLNVFWYRQRFGEMPQFMARPYSNAQGYTFADEFNDSRFNITLNGNKFDLNIKETKESDRGDYLCVNLDGTTPKFTSGTRLQFE